ncbi:MAG TPA: CoA pyrophosphatase [Dehalococcoidia bacterium]|nr:CoA pyrophosphatase [Dehalococcoidia bacterium]HIK88234.1 CoA pyrophosphatase [Dehalococcoidia bacterium]
MNTTKLTIKQLETTLRSYSGGSQRAEGNGAAAAVSVLFNMTDGEPCVLMIKRAATLRHHSGEWAFPGGMTEDSDESLMHTALRETNEELGIDSNDIDIWCQMSSVDTSTGFEVRPYTGRVKDAVKITPQESEVAEVVSVPVRIFVDAASKRTITLIRNGQTRKITAYAYEDRIIWGASGRIISDVIDVVMNAA